MKKTYLIISLTILFISSCASRPTTQVSKQTAKTKVAEKSVTNLIIIDHKYFKIAYNSKRRLPEYVTYQLTAENLKNKAAERNNKFIPDPYLVDNNIPYVVTGEYAKSGYDRGHLAPSADFAWNQEANNLTFVMSNMAPQTPGLNRDAWKRLEDKVRRWACGEEKITVITGPVLTDNLKTLKSGLEIPQEFFKIIIDESAPKKSIAFLYYQTDKGNVLSERVVSMNNIEKATGIAFNQDFPELGYEKMRVPASLNEWKEADCK
jgi:endonuclease G